MYAIRSYYGKRRAQSLFAYLAAKQNEKEARTAEAYEQERLLSGGGIKILILAHRYNIKDKYTGEPILHMLREMGAIPVIGSERNNFV